MFFENNFDAVALMAGKNFRLPKLKSRVFFLVDKAQIHRG